MNIRSLGPLLVIEETAESRPTDPTVASIGRDTFDHILPKP